MLDRYLAPGYLYEEMRPGDYGDPDHPGWTSAPAPAPELFAQTSASPGLGVFDRMLLDICKGLQSIDLDKKSDQDEISTWPERIRLAWVVRDAMMLGIRSFAKNKKDSRFSAFFGTSFPDRLGEVFSLINESRADTQSVKFASPNCEHWGAEVEVFSHSVGPGNYVNSRYVYKEGQVGPWDQPAPPSVEFRHISNVVQESPGHVGVGLFGAHMPVSLGSFSFRDVRENYISIAAMPEIGERFSHEELRLYHYFATGKAVPASVLIFSKLLKTRSTAKSVEGAAPSGQSASAIVGENSRSTGARPPLPRSGAGSRLQTQALMQQGRSPKYPDPGPAFQFQPQIRAPSMRFGGGVSSSFGFVQSQPSPFGPAAPPRVIGSSSTSSIVPAQPQPPASASLVSRNLLSSGGGTLSLQKRGQPQEGRARPATLKEGLEGHAGRPATAKEDWIADIAAVYRVVLPSKMGEVPAIVERNEGRLAQFYIGLLKRNAIPSFDLQTYVHVVSRSKLIPVWKWNSRTGEYASREGGC